MFYKLYKLEMVQNKFHDSMDRYAFSFKHSYFLVILYPITMKGSLKDYELSMVSQGEQGNNHFFFEAENVNGPTSQSWCSILSHTDSGIWAGAPLFSYVHTNI